MKKFVVWLVILALVAAVSVSATLAYLTDADEDVNVMTLGRVRIDQLEYERIDPQTKDEDAKVQEFHNEKPLLPGVYVDSYDWSIEDAYVNWEQIDKNGYTSGIWDPNEISNELDKMVFVKNKGNFETYARTVFGFKTLQEWSFEEFQKKIHLNLNETDWSWDWVQVPVEIGGGHYYVAVATYKYPLAPGKVTEISLSQVAMDKSVTNEEVAGLGETYQILAKSQAIQTDGFKDPKVALDTGFGPIDATHVPWENDDPTLGSNLRHALHYLNADGVTWIADDIDLVVFGNVNDEEYHHIAMTNDGTLVDSEQEVEVNCYYVQNKEGRYEVYFLASDTIYTPEDCSEMFADMNYLKTVVTENMSTAKTVNMHKMFSNCHSLTNIDVHHWDTSNVTDMSYLFSFCTYLQTLDLTSWDVSNVTNMNSMFFMDATDNFGAKSALTGIDVSNWNVSKVTDMANMFRGCTSLQTLNLSQWDVSNVTTLERTFSDCMALTTTGIENWNTSSLTSLRDTFVNCTSIPTLDLTGWNVSKVTDMQGTFTSLTSCTNLDLTGWNTSSCTNMLQTFWNCGKLTTIGGISDWDVSNVVTMRGLFGYCSLTSRNFYVDLSKWDTSSCTNMQYMFYLNEFSIIDGLGSFDTSNVTTFNRMFYDCEALKELDLSGWDTSSATDMYRMFYYCVGLKTIYASEDFTTENVTSGGQMFYNCRNLVGGNGTAYSGSNITSAYAHIDEEGNPGYFTHINDKPVTGEAGI